MKCVSKFKLGNMSLTQGKVKSKNLLAQARGRQSRVGRKSKNIDFLGLTPK